MCGVKKSVELMIMSCCFETCRLHLLYYYLFPRLVDLHSVFLEYIVSGNYGLQLYLFYHLCLNCKTSKHKIYLWITTQTNILAFKNRFYTKQDTSVINAIPSYQLYNKLLRIIIKFKMQLGGTLFHFSTTYYAILLKMWILRLCWSLLILPKSFDQEKDIWETKHSDFSFRYISYASLLKRYVFTIQFWKIVFFFLFSFLTITLPPNL